MDTKKLMLRFDWLGHIAEAAVITAVIAVALLAFGIDFGNGLVIGGIFAVGHFHGREKRDYEVSVRMHPPHLKGYLIWRWSKDQLTDFLPVVVVFLVVFGCMVVFG